MWNISRTNLTSKATFDMRNTLRLQLFTLFKNCSSCQYVWKRPRSVCICLHESRLNSTSGVWGRPLWIVAPIFQIVKGLVHHAVCMSQSYFSPLSECSLVIFHSRVLLGYLFCACVIWKTRAEKRNGEGSRKLKSLSETEDLLNRSPRDLKVTHYSSSI